MYQDIDQLLNEILEHTKDCDFNRTQHFAQNKRLNIMEKGLNSVQIGCLIALIVYYMVASQIEFPNPLIMTLLPIVLSIVATITELISYFSNCGELSQRHWLAAQAYTRLYRECQFFCTHYAEINDINVLRQKAHDISNAICDLNLLSPNLDEKTYSKATLLLGNKHYPIEDVITEARLKRLDVVLETIKSEYALYSIEIIAFGSYLHGIHYDDIDLAVIVYADDVDKFSLERISVNIQNKYIELGLDLDITIITEKDLSISAFLPFIRNIQSGKRLYIAPAVKRGVFEKTYGEIDYNVILKYFYHDAIFAYDKEDTRNFILKSYYFFYHTIACILSRKNIPWYGEDSISRNFYRISHNNEWYQTIYTWFMILRKGKNNELINDFFDDINTDELYAALNKINNWLQEENLNVNV